MEKRFSRKIKSFIVKLKFIGLNLFYGEHNILIGKKIFRNDLKSREKYWLMQFNLRLPAK